MHLIRVRVGVGGKDRYMERPWRLHLCSTAIVPIRRTGLKLRSQIPALHMTTIALHYSTIGLYYTILQILALHRTTIALHSTPLHSTTLHYTPLHSTPLHSTTLHYIALA